MDEIEALAYILEGEAGTCGVLAMLAVAFVYSRNDVMYGNADPSDTALLIAEHWYKFTDTSNGANFAFSDRDLSYPAVREIIGRSPPVMVYDCAGGRHINLFKIGEQNENLFTDSNNEGLDGRADTRIEDDRRDATQWATCIYFAGAYNASICHRSLADGN